MQVTLYTKSPGGEYVQQDEAWNCEVLPVPGERIDYQGRPYRVEMVFADTSPGEPSVYATEEQADSRRER